MMNETPKWLGNWIAFIKGHEKLVIVVLAAFLLFKTGQGIENTWIRHEDHQAQQATNQVNTDTVTNKALTDQVAQLKSDAELQKRKIENEMDSAVFALSRQQQADAKATQQEILDRWKLLLPIKPGAVQSNGNTDTITPEAANQTVQALEQIPVLQLQVNDLNAKLLIDNGIISKQDELITGLNKQIVDEHASHVADVNLEKAKAKKSYLRGLKHGMIIGGVFIEAIRVWAGRP